MSDINISVQLTSNLTANGSKVSYKHKSDVFPRAIIPFDPANYGMP
ncbi:hypothetical protein ABHN05_11355 [Brevibacillus laterosporus]